MHRILFPLLALLALSAHAQLRDPTLDDVLICRPGRPAPPSEACLLVCDTGTDACNIRADGDPDELAACEIEHENCYFRCRPPVRSCAI